MKCPESRFFAKLSLPLARGKCWHWKGALTDRGYPSFWFDGRVDYAHRFAYLKFVGEIPAGKQIDHLCRNRDCVNPRHLEVVTQRVNMLRGECPSAVNARRTHCIRGHKLSGRNLYVTPTGKRQCRECRRRARRKCYALSRV